MSYQNNAYIRADYQSGVYAIVDIKKLDDYS